MDMGNTGRGAGNSTGRKNKGEKAGINGAGTPGNAKDSTLHANDAIRADSCELPPLYAYEDPGASARPNGRAREQPQPARKPLGFRRGRDIYREERCAEWLIPEVLEAHVIAMMVAKAGSYKSFVALHWCMEVAMARKRVVILSAEGAGLSNRLQAWMRTHGNGRDFPDDVLVLERIINLNIDETFTHIAEDLEAESFGKPDLIVIDTFSKYALGLDENSNTDVALFMSRLAVQLKERYGSTVLVVTHTGHGEESQGRARGASAIKANTDAEYIVQKQEITGEGWCAVVSRERFKDYEPLPPLIYKMQKVDLGRKDPTTGKPVTSLAPVSTAQADLRAAKPQPTGKNQSKLLAAIQTWASGHQAPPKHIKTDDLIGLAKVCGITRKSQAQETIDGLVRAQWLGLSIAGLYLLRLEDRL